MGHDAGCQATGGPTSSGVTCDAHEGQCNNHRQPCRCTDEPQLTRCCSSLVSQHQVTEGLQLRRCSRVGQWEAEEKVVVERPGGVGHYTKQLYRRLFDASKTTTWANAMLASLRGLQAPGHGQHGSAARGQLLIVPPVWLTPALKIQQCLPKPPTSMPGSPGTLGAEGLAHQQLQLGAGTRGSRPARRLDHNRSADPRLCLRGRMRSAGRKLCRWTYCSIAQPGQKLDQRRCANVGSGSGRRPCGHGARPQPIEGSFTCALRLGNAISAPVSCSIRRRVRPCCPIRKGKSCMQGTGGEGGLLRTAQPGRSPAARVALPAWRQGWLSSSG
jgi:hypothetical protein